MDGKSEGVQPATVHVGLQLGTGGHQCLHRLLCKWNNADGILSSRLFTNSAHSQCAAMIIKQSGSLLNCIIGGEHTLKAHYFLLFSKYSEIIETFIFVLRKKQSQVSFLHVYHHVMTVLMPTMSIHLEPGANIIRLLINE